MARTRIPNTRLRALIEETDWTQGGLARAVNAVAAEAGLVLRYDRTTVSHWLTGSRPMPRVQPFACEALGRRCGRVITAEEAGFAGQVAVGPVQLAPADANGLVGLLHALSGPIPYRPARTRPVSRASGTGRGTAAVVGVVRAPCARNSASLFFTRTLQAQGGGFARGTLRTYLTEAVAGQLRSVRGELRRERYAEASQLTLVLGRMYADDLRNGEAQHCYLAARDLAITAGNRELTVIALRTLSVQAYGLGHPRIADEVARAAVRIAHAAPRAVRAFAQAQLAVTAASCGERTDALRALSEAESGVGPEEAGRHPFESYARADLEFQRGEALLALREPAEAVPAFEYALAARALDDRRGAALTRLRLADVLLRLGRVDETRALERELREEADGLRSAAVTRRKQELRRSLLRLSGGRRAG
ncbi:hypothetical protein OG194_43480 [Streptomyces sp. NBC_01288]|uniref:tetratricopeptide repeat protein n=1 Tax=Streptomyces sp. NBC_01288 TaxID=2903814 RepID=UPI002E0FAFB0|nr:hypothetical protein OG194_43480 [Streptomyces sp. NBC_01288]